MARRKSFARMSLDSLIEMRDAITSTLSEKTTELQKQLARMTGMDGASPARRGRKPGRKPGRKSGSSLKGRKVAAKYRSRKHPELTWAGRGATPRWMREEMKTRKLKKEAFLIK
jgi:DNA-binding protein H-NS